MILDKSCKPQSVGISASRHNFRPKISNPEIYENLKSLVLKAGRISLVRGTQKDLLCYLIRDQSFAMAWMTAKANSEERSIIICQSGVTYIFRLYLFIYLYLLRKS